MGAAEWGIKSNAGTTVDAYKRLYTRGRTRVRVNSRGARRGKAHRENAKDAQTEAALAVRRVEEIREAQHRVGAGALGDPSRAGQNLQNTRPAGECGVGPALEGSGKKQRAVADAAQRSRDRQPDREEWASVTRTRYEYEYCEQVQHIRAGRVRSPAAIPLQRSVQ